MVLEPIWQGYIQVEDVTALRSWSEYALQKFGHNLNYLKNLDLTQSNLVNDFYTTNGQNIDNGFGLPTTTTHTSPNSKPFRGGAFTNVFNGFDIGIGFVIQGYQHWNVALSGGFINYNISGNTLNNTSWAHETVWSIGFDA